MIQEIAPLDASFTDPTIPLYYSHFENGMYYYISTCCDMAPSPIHYGLIASITPISTDKLGCLGNTPISGPMVSLMDPTPTAVTIPIGHIIVPWNPIDGEPTRFIGNGDIKNKLADVPDNTKPFHMNPCGAKEFSPVQEAKIPGFEGDFRVRSMQVMLLDARRSFVTCTFFLAFCIRPVGTSRRVYPLDVLNTSSVFGPVRAGRLMTARLNGQPFFIVNDV